MKITILQSNLAKSLNMVSKIVGQRTTLPVLSNILINANKGKISFSSTDLEVGITTYTIGKIDEEGSITLPARLLSDFILNNKDESIEISTEGTIAKLKSSHFEATLHGISPEEFPTIPEPTKDYLVKVERKSFLDSVKKVGIAPATDETRPVLAGIFMQFEGKTLTLAATDSYRLSEKRIVLADEVAEKKVIIPTRAMQEVNRILASTDSIEEVDINFTDNQASFIIGDSHIVSRLIEGSFPNYTPIIPASSKTKVETKTSEFAAAVKMSSLFARNLANNNIKVAVKDSKLTVSSEGSEAGASKSQIEATVTGGDVEVSFNAKYILDILSVIGDEKIILEFNDSSSAGAFKSEKDPDFVYIVMPLKLES